MSELPPDEPSIAAAGAARTAELARGDADPIAERRRAFDRERKRRASAKAPPAESQHEKSSVVAKAGRIQSRHSHSTGQTGARIGVEPKAIAILKPLTPANDNLIDQTRKVWQRRLGRNVSREDAREIAENVCGFFKILTEWSREELPKQANDNCAQSERQCVERQKRGRTRDANDGEQGRSRP
jgi:hypothetical protein